MYGLSIILCTQTYHYYIYFPGYYTRSGYVPGPVCKYNWTKVWKVAEDRNVIQPQVRHISVCLSSDTSVDFRASFITTSLQQVHVMRELSNFVSE